MGRRTGSGVRIAKTGGLGVNEMKKTVWMGLVVAGGLSWSEAALTNEVPQQNVVVTATRVEQSLATVGSSVTVVDQAQLSERQCRTAYDALREVPGLDVVQLGGAGGTMSTFIRGAASEQTLVLVDGVPVNDPAGLGRGADLSQMPVQNVERIEVLRGPQSTLYGADAIGGVINVITKKGAGPVGGEVSAEAGSFNTFNETAAVRGGTSNYNYSVGVSRQDSDGISSAAEKNGNPEKDGYRRTDLSSKLGWTPVDEFEANVLVRWNKADYDYDDFMNGRPVDGDNQGVSDLVSLYGEGKGKLIDGQWRPRVGGSWVSQSREDTSSVGNSSFESLLQKLEWQNDMYLGNANIVTAGIEAQQESAESTYESFGYVDQFNRKTAKHRSAYVQDILSTGPLTTTVGGRVDSYDSFGTENTWRVAPSYDIAATGTRFKGSYGTGFKAPSLFQLYSSYGSPELNPETSQGWDAGVEQKIAGDLLVVGATYFENQFDDLIDYDFVTMKYGNINQAETRGVETFVTAQPVKELSVRAAYTYTDTENKITGDPLLRRPRNKVSLDTTYAFTAKLKGTVGVIYVGERTDEDFVTYMPATLDGYMLVNLYASYDVRKNVTLFGRLENLFDEDYEQAIGYGTPGRAGYGGVKVTF
jgi:vitamin B12 transporter